MAEDRKVSIPGPDGKMLPGIDMEIEESSERWSEMKLHDGTRLRVKSVVTQVVRLDNAYDPEGNPVYIVKTAPVITLLSTPDFLKRGNKK